MSIIKNLYVIFIRKLLCAVTLSRHFHVVTTALNALCAVCSVHGAYQIFYSNRLSAIIENIAKTPCQVEYLIVACVLDCAPLTYVL